MATVTPSRKSAPAATATRWTPLRSLLEEQRAERVRQRDLALVDTVASVPDPVAMARSAQLLHTIEEIDDAVARLEAGTYGRCVSCESAIPVERLEFLPFAARCVTCQRRAA
jgi:RNA polymerase-binding transcription factor DksA